jgi:hypothetical protein
MSNLAASAWVVCAPTYGHSGTLSGFRMVRIVQSRPSTLAGGERAFKLNVSVPMSVFQPFANVNVHVPEGDLIEPLVEIGE